MWFSLINSGCSLRQDRQGNQFHQSKVKLDPSNDGKLS